MKLYYLAVGFAGLAAALYLDVTCRAVPWWAAALISYACGTPAGTAISMHIRERHNAKYGGLR